MSAQTAEKTPPLDDVMLAMDVVDTLRHRRDLVERELDGAAREQELVEKLRQIYHQQGIEVPDHILKEGVSALAQSRFTYAPPKGGLRVALARLYVARRRWAGWAGGLAVAAIVVLAGYYLVYRPYEASQTEQALIELSEVLPSRMDELYNAIYEETKVQSAVIRAEELRGRGKIAAREGDRTGAESAVAALTELRDTLRQDYVLRVVNRDDVQSGFWTFPEINTDATNYYVVVEAINEAGERLELPILNEESGETETVEMWGLRVPEGVYDSVEADKRDDGIIQRNVVGRKAYGYLEVDYVVPVLGGAVTRW